MKQIELGKTGQKVSELALGCMWMGTNTPEDAACAILDRYLDAGGNFLDTANCYAWFSGPGATGTESERVLGRWLAASRKRQKVFLASKVGGMVRDPMSLWSASGEADWARARREYEGASAETVRRGIDASLRRLETDYLDLYYVHVDDWVTPLEETLEALADLVRAGKVRHIGWSNVRTERLESIRQLCNRQGWPAPVALQQQHTYLRPRPGLDSVSIVNEAQLEHLRRHPELTLIAYSPVLKGLYDDPDKRRGHWIMPSYEGPDSESRLAALERSARQLGVRPNQLVLAWLLAQRAPRVIPLVGPRTHEQLEQHLEALNIELSPELRSTLDAAGARESEEPPHATPQQAAPAGS